MIGIESAAASMSSPEGDFLRHLFTALEQHGVTYAVMRNYQTLPFSHGGSDLDILVHPSSKQHVQNAIDSALKSSNAIRLGTTFAPGFFKVYILGNNTAHHYGWWGLRIDINIGLYFKGLQLLNENVHWPNDLHHSIYVLPPGFSGILGVLKEVLNNDLIPERYLPAARTATTEDWPTITKLLSPMGSKTLTCFHQLLLQTPDNPQQACAAIRRSFFHYCLLKNPVTFILGRLNGLFSKVSRYLRPSGMVIAILGTDGAGKSTIINAIKPALDQATHNATVIRHLRPNFLPPLARLKSGRNIESSGTVTNPHGSSSSGFLGSLLRISYATLNYVMGYWFNTRIHIAKQPTIVIFDRYAYDMALDPKRFRIALPPELLRFFVRLAPKPDLIFCLHGNPEIIYSRKKEIPLHEVARQTEAIIDFANSHPTAVLVDTTVSIEDSRDKILKTISETCKSNQLDVCR